MPVVFYQGARGWSHSTELADLFPEAARSWPWVPKFAHELLAEGRVEGQVEVVEGLLRVGVTWDVIEAATGLNEARFRALKDQLTDSGS